MESSHAKIVPPIVPPNDVAPSGDLGRPLACELMATPQCPDMSMSARFAMAL
jgi:hypothetical protein